MTSCNGSTASKGIETANLDTTVSPKEDFYQYACGGWMSNNPIKPEYSRYGTFEVLGDNNREQLRELILGLNPEAEEGTNEQKVAGLYHMGMDSVRLNNEGAQPLSEDLAVIASTPREKIIELIATMPGVDAFFNTGVGADLKNSSINTMYLAQGGLGLGNRDYYTENNERNTKVLEAYQTYLTTIAGLIGYSEEEAKRFSDNVLAIERELAKDHLTRTEQRDIARLYNPTTVGELIAKYPTIDLKSYFSAQKVDVDTIVVENPRYYATVAKFISDKDIQALRDYITASYVSTACSYLSDEFIDAEFQLNKAISGVEELQPRWKRALSVPNGMLGEVVGQLYVEKYFPETSKERMIKLVDNLKEALGQHIENLTWMSDATKAKALEKLATFHVKIGYPDTWRDYSGLTIDTEKSYWQNIQAAILFNMEYNNNDYGKPVDRERWQMSPQTVNAYYDPTTNEICFPAGILQAPFFDPSKDDACNYGAIGVVIGHEMTHGFDDQGRQFDKDGNFVDWWTEADAEAFNALANKLVEQFDEIVVAGDTHANGQLTLGENIADQGGLRVAHTAYVNSLGGAEAPDIDGFTADQRFYLSYANLWAANIRESEILKRTSDDPHSLGRWRVNATLRNIQPFFDAFDINEGDAMFRPEAERVIIW
ncbi:MAG: M13 family metallopeptidase [Muribaculaceae bacterium]|nr:M13 family metallopeptidase [Muribaculaceae bacterium]